MAERKMDEFEEKVIQVDRIARVVKGGRRMRFRATVVVGNRKGKVGIGIAKAQEVSAAVQKAVAKAKKHMIVIPITNETLPHQGKVYLDGAHIMFRPATAGTGIIAGGAVRVVLEVAGVKNVSSKILGSSNKVNNAQATFLFLKRLRTWEQVAGSRGIATTKKKADAVQEEKQEA